jgi:hypothetical protein
MTRRKGINGRSKGASGEREFAKWLESVLGLSWTPQRNLEQVRSGGADIIDIFPFIFEVKRCESLSLKDWWVQVVNACSKPDEIPVVAYRQNRQPWRFLISAKNIGLDKGYIQLDEHVFKPWLQKHFI